MDMTVVSPFTHLNGHYWPYTVDLLDALGEDLKKVSVFASRPARQTFSETEGISWNACFPWTKHILSDAYRSRNWGSREDSIARNIEFQMCVRAAIRACEVSKDNSHIHCVESRHRILNREVIRNRHLTFSTLCVGDPPENLPESRANQYKRAFQTGRLTFIVETETVRKNWEDLAGERVVHIPAALPSQPHTPVAQEEARKKLNLPPDATICLFFGTHREGKDYETAVRAAGESESKPFLWFVGPLISGNDPAQITMRHEYSATESLSGYLPDESVSLVFDAADAVVLPYSEGYQKGSAVLLQACHFKKPVIATRTGHLKDFVELNHNGFLFEAGSSRDLASCYDQVHALKHSSDLVSRFSFKTAVENYSWPVLKERYMEVFRNEISSCR